MRCKYCKEVIFWDKTGCYPTWRHTLTNKAYCTIMYAIPLEEAVSAGPKLEIQQVSVDYYLDRIESFEKKYGIESFAFLRQFDHQEECSANVDYTEWAFLIRQFGDELKVRRAAPALAHLRSCPALRGENPPVQSPDCTCALQERIYLQTEQTMHNAWRKRAEESELREVDARIAQLERDEAIEARREMGQDYALDVEKMGEKIDALMEALEPLRNLAFSLQLMPGQMNDDIKDDYGLPLNYGILRAAARVYEQVKKDLEDLNKKGS